MIVTHDTGRHLGCYGVPTVQTPAIDTLAAQGRRFTRFFSVNPICSPSRASLFTGRYPQSHGVTTIVNKAKGITLNAGERHLAQVLQGAGFQTALFGLQHEATDSASLGFAEVREDKPRQPADVVGRKVAEYLKQVKDPFYIQVGFFETHTPYDFGGAPPDESGGVHYPPFIRKNEAARKWLAGLQGAARRADEGVRIILDALEASGQADDTLVIFTVDHGVELPRAKWFLYDPGLGVAFICRWPKGGIGAGTTCEHLISNVDVFPTVLEMLGLPVPANVQGVSFAPLLKGKSSAPVRAEVFGFQTGYEMRCVRTEGHKLIRNFERHAPCTCPGDVAQPRQAEPCSPLVELYDLQNDPHEFTNLADEPALAPVRADLTRRLRHWMEEQDDPILKGTAQVTDFYQQALSSLKE